MKKAILATKANVVATSRFIAINVTARISIYDDL